MTVIGCAILIIYTIGIVKSILHKNIEGFKYKTFLAMIGFSIFVNIGYSVFYLPYNIMLEILYIGISIICRINKRNFNINRKYFVASLVLIGAICIGDIQLFFVDMPNVIPFSISMDSVYHAENSLSKATFSDNNIQYLRNMLLFIVVLGFSLEYIRCDEQRRRLISDVKKMFVGMFVIWTLEWVVNNFISPNIWREVVYNLFGNADIRKTYSVSYRFVGYSFNGFFTEPSYITVMLIYYAILWKQKLQSITDYLIYVWSILLLILNGSTSGMMLLIMAAILLIRNVGAKTKKRILICFFSTILILGTVIVANYTSIQPIINKVVLYLQAYIRGGSYTSSRETAAAIRKYGNSIAYAAFIAKPFLGVGFGTTRGYGILPGTLACLGVVGTLIYAYYIKSAFNLKRNLDSTILLCVLIGYSTTILSVWYLYYPALIPIYVCLACTTRRQENEMI